MPKGSASPSAPASASPARPPGPGRGPPVALTIGGSDSAGRCGVQADLRTFAALGVHGCCALTVVTAQDTRRVHAAWPLPVAAVVGQIETVLDDLDVAAGKVGMLGGVALVEAVADLAAAGRLPVLVVDPVLVSGAGEVLFPPEVADVVRRRLLPRARVITPNRDELALLTGRPVTTAGELADAARALAGELADTARSLAGHASPAATAGAADVSGPGASPTAPVVVATGGRLGGSESVDVVATADSVTALAAPRVTTANVAGTGDTLSAAVAAGLAHGLETPAAIAAAKAFVSRAVAGSAGWAMGGGRGPIDHLGWSAPYARSS